MPIKGNNALEEERVKACINSGMVIETFLRWSGPLSRATELCFYSQQFG
jgi:hypothetical protein